MKIFTKKGKGKVKLTDKQMSVIMSGLAMAFAHWKELSDPEVTTTRKELVNTSHYLLTAYAKSAGVSEKDLTEAIDKATEEILK